LELGVAIKFAYRFSVPIFRLRPARAREENQRARRRAYRFQRADFRWRPFWKRGFLIAAKPV